MFQFPKIPGYPEWYSKISHETAFEYEPGSSFGSGFEIKFNRR